MSSVTNVLAAVDIGTNSVHLVVARVDASAPAHLRRLDTPMVGRGRELDLIRQAFERTVDERNCHLFTLLGPAGIGKSRLVSSFVSDIGARATILRGRCLPYGEGITFWPLLEALPALGGAAAPVLERLAGSSDLF